LTALTSSAPQAVSTITDITQGSTFSLGKKPWGQLAPKFIDLVASTNFLVAKTFSPLTVLYYKEQSTANSNSFKIAQKTAFEAQG